MRNAFAYMLIMVIYIFICMFYRSIEFLYTLVQVFFNSPITSFLLFR